MPQAPPKVASDSAAKTGSQPSRGQKEVRDTIESIVIAFVLAFLFRTFEAEAFVIPTGSMAPTLYGRHKEALCEQCGYKVVVGASDELDQNTGRLDPQGYFIRSALCPNCRAANSFDRSDPVFNGDRILVNKYPYEFGEPTRWDVIVFKYPEEPRTNYIKRLVGLPGETLRIIQGDVYRVGRGSDESDGDTLEMLRKDDPTKQRDLQILVYDDRYPPTALLEQGWPERWAPMEPGHGTVGPDGWVETDTGWTTGPPEQAGKGRVQPRNYVLTLDDSRGERPRWLRYRHYMPEPGDWEAATSRQPARMRPQMKLVTDFCGYNAYHGGQDDDAGDGLYWVGDLAVTGAVQIQDVADGAELIVELREGARTYRCHIDPQTGTARLTYQDAGEEQPLAHSDTAVRGPGSYTVALANIDGRLTLWINGDAVALEGAGIYPPHGGDGALQEPTDGDLIPAGIGARNMAVTLSELVLTRDIYYRNEFMNSEYQFTNGRFPEATVPEYAGPPSDLERLATRPAEWFEEYSRRLAAHQTGPGERYEGVDFTFALGPDEFFGMGDNSPRSRDSRLWPNERRDEHRYAIPRKNLVGKAFFIYWPHGVPFLNDGKGYPSGPDSLLSRGPLRALFYHRKMNGDIDTSYPQYRIPFYPNFARMHRIR